MCLSNKSKTQYDLSAKPINFYASAAQLLPPSCSIEHFSCNKGRVWTGKVFNCCCNFIRISVPFNMVQFQRFRIRKGGALDQRSPHIARANTIACHTVWRDFIRNMNCQCFHRAFHRRVMNRCTNIGSNTAGDRTDINNPSPSFFAHSWRKGSNSPHHAHKIQFKRTHPEFVICGFLIKKSHSFKQCTGIIYQDIHRSDLLHFLDHPLHINGRAEICTDSPCLNAHCSQFFSNLLSLFPADRIVNNYIRSIFCQSTRCFFS